MLSIYSSKSFSPAQIHICTLRQQIHYIIYIYIYVQDEISISILLLADNDKPTSEFLRFVAELLLVRPGRYPEGWECSAARVAGQGVRVSRQLKGQDAILGPKKGIEPAKIGIWPARLEFIRHELGFDQWHWRLKPTNRDLSSDKPHVFILSWA